MVFFSKKVSFTSIYDNPEESNFEKVTTYKTICTPSSEHGLNNSNVQKIIHSQDLYFDLVINEEMFHESWLMFAYKFNTPIVTISTYGYSDFFDQAMGMLTPISHVPHMLLPYGDDMTYSQRVYNVILTMFDWLFRTWVTLPKQNEIAQRYFGHLASKFFSEKKTNLLEIILWTLLSFLPFQYKFIAQNQENHCQKSKNCIEIFR